MRVFMIERTNRSVSNRTGVCAASRICRVKTKPFGCAGYVCQRRILEAACIGIPDDESGEVAKLFVVIKPGSAVSPRDVRQYCKGNMTPYKVPKVVEFIDELPKSNVGKILRRELRDLHAESAV